MPSLSVNIPIDSQLEQHIYLAELKRPISPNLVLINSWSRDHLIISAVTTTDKPRSGTAVTQYTQNLDFPGRYLSPKGEKNG
jgi:hypothetical protein